jgi:hypothetical protein
MLSYLDETQKTAALASRAEAQKQVLSSTETRTTAQAGLASLVMPGGGPGGPGGNRGGGNAAVRTQTTQSRAAVLSPPKTIWYMDNGKLKALQVHTGISDGSKTEVYPVNPNQSIEGLSIILREKVQV